MPARLCHIAAEQRRYSCRRASVLLRRKGIKVNHKHLQCLWRPAGVNLPRHRPKENLGRGGGALAIQVRPSFPARQVIAVPEPLFAATGAPDLPHSDNGPEFIAHAIQAWLAAWGAQPYYIDPGSPWQDA